MGPLSRDMRKSRELFPICIHAQLLPTGIHGWQSSKHHTGRNKGNICSVTFLSSYAELFCTFQGDGQKTLHEACDKSLIDIIQLLKVEIVIGIGNYAEKRAQLAVQTGGLPVQVTYYNILIVITYNTRFILTCTTAFSGDSSATSQSKSSR